MSLEVTIRQGESQESLLRRFQRMIQVEGVLRELKSTRHFMSKGETARLKAQKSARRRRRLAKGPRPGRTGGAKYPAQAPPSTGLINQ